MKKPAIIAVAVAGTAAVAAIACTVVKKIKNR